jgi:RNA polymerase sigma-70 factor (ECF subfamily)
MQDNPHNERELLNRVSQGDPEAYAVLFRRYFDRIYANAFHFTKSRDLAEDICQEVFIRVWNYREKLLEVDSFEAWLVTITKNFIRNTLKKKVLPVSNEAYLLAYLKDKSPSRQEVMEVKEWENKLYKGIALLPPQMQTAFRLSRFHGLSHEQIARKMNISRVTSQNYIARALLFLRKYVREHGDQLGLLLFFLFS